MAIQKTVKLLQLYDAQQRDGHDPELTGELREAVEGEIEREDNRYFRPGNPVGQQLSKAVGQMLKDKPEEHYMASREGARGVRG